MTTVRDVYNAIDAIAPFSSALDWDNCGLLVGDPSRPVEKVLAALDVTPEVVAEAVRSGAQLIISHHPVIFHPLKALTPGQPAFLAAAAGVAVISAHTNYDMAPAGVNKALADALGLTGLQPLAVEASRPFCTIAVFVPREYQQAVYAAMAGAGAGRLGNYSGCAFSSDGEGVFVPEAGAHPFLGTVGAPEQAAECRLQMLVPPDRLSAVIAAMRAAHPYEEPAFDVFENHAAMQETTLGLVGALPREMSEAEFAAAIADALHITPRYNPGARRIRHAAVCGGAGGNYAAQAARHPLRPQAMVTGEARHHEFLQAAAAELTLYDAAHYNTEAPALSQLLGQLRTALPEVQFLRAESYDGTLICG